MPSVAPANSPNDLEMDPLLELREASATNAVPRRSPSAAVTDTVPRRSPDAADAVPRRSPSADAVLHQPLEAGNAVAHRSPSATNASPCQPSKATNAVLPAKRQRPISAPGRSTQGQTDSLSDVKHSSHLNAVFTEQWIQNRKKTELQEKMDAEELCNKCKQEQHLYAYVWLIDDCEPICTQLQYDEEDDFWFWPKIRFTSQLLHELNLKPDDISKDKRINFGLLDKKTGVWCNVKQGFQLDVSSHETIFLRSRDVRRIGPELDKLLQTCAPRSRQHSHMSDLTRQRSSVKQQESIKHDSSPLELTVNEKSNRLTQSESQKAFSAASTPQPNTVDRKGKAVDRTGSMLAVSQLEDPYAIVLEPIPEEMEYIGWTKEELELLLDASYEHNRIKHGEGSQTFKKLKSSSSNKAITAKERIATTERMGKVILKVEPIDLTIVSSDDDVPYTQAMPRSRKCEHSSTESVSSHQEEEDPSAVDEPDLFDELDLLDESGLFDVSNIEEGVIHVLLSVVEMVNQKNSRSRSERDVR
ncbi:hypothetical protein NM688_g2037 [Phlebia brevispora]|uniref:Uncharacterized protein n=1 Tax=Phlebia brevispora TaxID=194682 RepID=A0ACC1TA27_9APHY|nr:hypothetical protein NM688_g2037 [Phlebia brevispora]